MTNPTTYHLDALGTVPPSHYARLLDAIAAHLVGHEGMRRETFDRLARECAAGVA